MSLRSPRVQQAVIEGISESVRARFGASIEAEGFDLGLLSGRLEVRQLKLRAGDGAAFARCERVHVEFRPLSLIRGPLRVSLFELERPEFDLDAQLPEVVDAGSPEAQAPVESLGFRIDSLLVRNGYVTGSPPSGALPLLEDWQLVDIDAQGRFDGKRLTLLEMTAAARIGWEARPPIELPVATKAWVELSGFAEVESFVVDSPELSLDASLRFGGSLASSAADFRIETSAGTWLATGSTRPVTLAGQVDLESWTGSAQLLAAEQPGSLITDLDLLGPELAAALETDSTELNLRLDLELAKDPESRRKVVGALRAAAVRGGRPVLEIEAEPRLDLGAGASTDWAAGGAEVAVALNFLSGEDGVRRSTARLISDDFLDSESWRVEDGMVEIKQPDIERFLAVVSNLWPGILAPSAIDGLPALGVLAARAEFGGRLEDPWVDGIAQIRPDPSGRIEVSAKGRPLSNDWVVDAAGFDLELANLTPALGGRLDFTGKVRDPLGAASGSLELVARELATESGTVFPTVTVDLRGSFEAIEWQVDGALAEAGRIQALGTLRPELPLRVATGSVVWETGDNRLPRVDGTFEFSDGALSTALFAPRDEEGVIVARLEVPLAALAQIPELSEHFDLASLPVARSAGPVLLTWQVPKGEWSEFVVPQPVEPVEPVEPMEPVEPVESAGLPQSEGASKTWRQRLGRLAGGSKGSLSLDLACLTCSVGEAQLHDVVFEFDGRRALANGPLRLSIEAGNVLVEPWTLKGDGFDVAVEGEASLSRDWQPGDSLQSVLANSRGTVSGDIASSWLALFPIEISSPGTIRLRAETSGPPTALTGSGSLSAPGLELTLAAHPGLVLADPAVELSLREGVISWEKATVEWGGGELRSEGRIRLDDPLGSASGNLRLTSDQPVVSAVDLSFETTEGRLTIDDGRLTTAGGEGRVTADIPLDGRPGATATAQWNVPANDWAPLLARLLGSEDPETLELASQGTLSVPLDRPAEARAEIQLSAGRIVVRGRETVIEPGVHLSLRDGVLSAAPFRLRTAEERFSFQASAHLDRGWRFGDEPAELVSTFELAGKGDVDSGLLNPFLAGGRAEGGLHLDIEVRGTPSAFQGHMSVDGPGTSFLYRSPYLARFENPSFEISVHEGRVALDRGELSLNEGSFEVSGVLSEAGRTDLGLRFRDSVFRLDHGLVATLGGDLRYRLGEEGRSTVTGVVDVERGVLTRNVQLDLDLLSELLAPIDLTTTEDDPLDLIDLDVAVRTREGVRVKNNLGDLLMRWEPLEVTGTVARPILEGRLEIDPGGLLYAYGQTVRLDKAAIEYPGEAGAEPRLAFEATTSLEDPTIGRLAGDDPFKATGGDQAGDAKAEEGFTADLARYYGEQLAGRVGESVGVTVSLRPLLIFGETDPGARLTIGRDLSPTLALAASIDLRGAEDRTYLLELHELRSLSRLVGQAFTDDRSAYGGALLQRRQWGGSRTLERGDLPKISKIVSTPPQGVSRRGIRRAMSLDKGDAFDARQRFVAEVELVDYLMAKGYPDARVSVRAVPEESRNQRVRLEVGIEPGPRVEFAFEGEKIAKPLRRLVRSLYRPDFFEQESIEEMRAETIRALRSRGFLDPTVDIEVEPVGAENAAQARRITVRTKGGIKISPEAPIFLGIDSEGQQVLTAAFANSVQRAELAFGLASADRRLLATLGVIGYPEARILKRYQSLETRALTVEIEPGARQRIASVSVEGLAAAAEIPEQQVSERIEVRAGDPVRRNRLSRSAIAVERYLGEQGYLEARVRTILEPAAATGPYAIPVRFVVDPGKRSILEAVEFRGFRSTRESYARRVVGLRAGTPLASNDLSQARTALWRTGLFSGVGSDIVESESGLDRAVFDLEERDRYRLTYGVRWNSADGIGAVVDATDDNFLGRGWTLGLRGLTSKEEDSLRGLARVPRAFGGPGALELFAASRKLTEISRDVIFGEVEVPVNVFESTLQYSHPVTDHTTLRVYGRYTDTIRKLPFFTLQVKNPQLGFQYLFDNRSPGLLTEKGLFASVDLSGSKEFLGGDLDYVRAFSQLSIFRPAGKLLGSRLQWSQSFRVGLAESFDQELTPDVRFFAGGEYSVRGYETESLGEQTRFGSVAEAAGGSALLVVNQELRWRLFDDYNLIVFADAGNVWTAVEDFGSDLFTSTGVGLRALTPVGLLRLDVARPLNGRSGIDPEYKVYFGLGATF